LPIDFATAARLCSSSSPRRRRGRYYCRSVADLRIGFADAGEDDLVAADAGFQGTVQLTALVTSKPSRARHQTAEVQGSVGLEAVADQQIDRGEGRFDLAEVMQQRRLAVDEQRCAVLLGQGAHRQSSQCSTRSR